MQLPLRLGLQDCDGRSFICVGWILPIEGTLEPELSLGFQEPRLIGRLNKPSKKTLPQGVAKRTPADFKFGGLEKKVGPMLGNRRFPLVPFSLRMKETIL